MKYLLDTNVLIDLLRNRKPEIAEKIMKVGVSECGMSQASLYELYCGAYIKDNMEDEIKRIDLLASKIAILDIPMKAAASQKGLMRLKGTLIDDLDIMIGATAYFNNLIMVTGNVSHFKHIQGIQIEDWSKQSYD